MYASVPSRGAFDLVVIAASQGGLAAYQRILAALPPSFPAAVVVLQHRAVRERDVLAGLLARGTQLAVEPAQAMPDMPPQAIDKAGDGAIADNAELERAHGGAPAADG